MWKAYTVLFSLFFYCCRPLHRVLDWSRESSDSGSAVRPWQHRCTIQHHTAGPELSEPPCLLLQCTVSHLPWPQVCFEFHEMSVFHFFPSTSRLPDVSSSWILHGSQIIERNFEVFRDSCLWHWLETVEMRIPLYRSLFGVRSVTQSFRAFLDLREFCQLCLAKQKFPCLGCVILGCSIFLFFWDRFDCASAVVMMLHSLHHPTYLLNILLPTRPPGSSRRTNINLGHVKAVYVTVSGMIVCMWWCACWLLYCIIIMSDFDRLYIIQMKEICTRILYFYRMV